MHIELTPDQVALRAEFDEYFATLMTPELRQIEHTAPAYKAAIRKMGDDGWLGISWPKEYGGQERPAVELMVFFDAAVRAGAPFPFLSVLTVGPAFMRWGTPAQKERYLPAILRGEIQFAVGYSESNAGTDLANLTTRALRDGDEYVINGDKMWTSGAHAYDYIWLACRTNPELERHKGLSLIIVPTTAPGLTVNPVYTMSERTNATFYDNVRVPVENLVGAENEGWKLITTQLNHERLMVGINGAATIERNIEKVRGWAQDTKLADGRRVIDQEWVQVNLARVVAKAEYLRLRNLHAVWSLDDGDLGAAEASATKVFSSESFIEAYQLLLEIVGQVGYLRDGSPDSVLRGELENEYHRTLLFTFGGGTNEIQREIIDMAGLGLPRAPR